MEFNFSAGELAFAEEIRQFMRAHPPAEFSHDGMDGYGSGAHSHAYLRGLAADGWLCMTLPRAFGGAERSLMHKLILLEELGRRARRSAARELLDDGRRYPLITS
jgi:alkylation response protein AidB-like acyl-CoA dehydrogenase